MEPKHQASNIEVKECFVLLERLDLNMYNDSSDPMDLSNLSFLLSQGGSRYKYKKRNLPLSRLFSYSEKGPHECKVCEKSFKTLKSYKNHLRHHSRKKPHICEECGASFYAPNKLSLHIRYRHTKEKPYRCAECDHAFVEMSKLKRHVQLCHTGERPYECPFCVYASADNFRLKRHLLVHTGEKPYECDICHVQFQQSCSLKSHKQFHSGNKPSFSCDFCPKTFWRKTDLYRHTRRVHIEKPVKCPQCEKILPDRYSYKLHLKTHGGEKYKCDICPYECKKPYSLKYHMCVYHSVEKPFKCDECDKAYALKQLLNSHKNVHHNPKHSASSPKRRTNKTSAPGKAFHHKDMKLENKNSGIDKKHCVENVEKTGNDEFDNDK